MNASDPISIICQILQGGGRPHMAHHDNWTPQMGTWVVINAGWYKSVKAGLLDDRLHEVLPSLSDFGHKSTGRSLLSC